MSPPSKVALSIKSQIFENSKPQQKENTNAVTKTKNINGSSSLINVTNENIKANIKEHEALIFNNFTPESYKPQKVYQAIPKINTDVKPIQSLKSDFRTNMKFPSTPNPIRHKDGAKSIPVPSYVEYPSEVVQKTTNFEGIDKLSSVADTEIEPCEDLSQCTLERSELDERDHLSWFHQHSSSATLLNFSKASDALTSSTWCSKDGMHTDAEKNWSDNYNYQDYLHHYCWKKGANKKYDDTSLKDHKGRSAKCQKYRRHSKKMHRLSHPFETLRKRITIGRLSQNRWKGVWKRTTEKWSSWKKSPRKLRNDRDRAMHCLRALNWDNANVQTTIFVYRETGPSGTSFKSDRLYNKHADVGPSMFTFLCGTNSSIIRKCVTRKKLKSLEHKISNTDVRKDIVESKEAATEAENQLNHKSTSSTPSLNNVVEIGVVTDAAPILENKVTAVTSTEISQSYPRVKRAVVACNTTTDTKWQPANGAESKENFPLQHAKSSTNDTETHVNQSSKAVSVGVWTSNQTIRYSKPNVVTDTTVPCRSIGAKEFSTMLTPKGTILSCTGTKITSVSSTSMPTQYIIPKRSAVVSTNVTVNNVDCLTARSLHLRGHKDVCLDTKGASHHNMYDDKASCTSECSSYQSKGVSAVDLLDQTSFNGGSHHTRRSVITEFHPVYNSTSTNIATEVKSKSVGKSCSGNSLERSDIELKVDTFAQYSGFDTCSETSKHTQQSACIGRSQLMSVRTLCGSATEATTQALPELLSAETRTTPRKHMSTSAFTSRYYLGEPICTSTSVMTQREVENVNPAPILICTCAQVGSATDPTTQKTPAEIPVLLSSNCKPINVGASPTEEQRKSPIQFVAKTSRSCTASNNYEPNTVISSNLNAAKWIKGYMNNVEKDYQSIVDISRSTVSESLERASYVLENSKVQLQETIKLAQQQQQQPSEREPAVNCVTSRLANASHDSLLDVLPTKEILNKPVDEKPILDCRMVDKETSDNVVKEMKETLIQASPIVRDSGFDPSPLPVKEQKSTSVLTTRCILPDPISCCNNKNIGGVKAASHECIFVYHQPQCIIHRHLIDAAVQRLPSCPDTETNPVKQDIVESHPVTATLQLSKVKSSSQENNSAKQSSTRHSEVIVTHNGMCLQQHSKGKSLAQDIAAKENTPNTGILIKSNAEMSHQEESQETPSPEEINSANQHNPNSVTDGLMTSHIGISSEKQEQQISCQASPKQDVRAATSPRKIQSNQDQQHTRELIGEVITPREINSAKQDNPNSDTAVLMTSHTGVSNQQQEQQISSQAYKALYETTKSMIKQGSRSQTPTHSQACGYIAHKKNEKATTRSMQSFNACVHCCCKLHYEKKDTVEEYIKAYLKTSCRYYSNILTKQLDKVKDNLMRNRMPDEKQNGELHSTSSRNLELADACTMKPSEKRDVYCQTRELTRKRHPDKIPSLTTALSAMDFRDSQDKQDLKIMYYMLSSIEGRIRRLKNNLISNT